MAHGWRSFADRIARYCQAIGRGRRRLRSPDVANLAYGPDPRMVIDIWLAGSATNLPLVVYFHGGGFMTGDKRWVDTSIVSMLLERGFSVALPMFRLAKNVGVQGCMLDARKSVRFLARQQRDLQIRCNELVLAGDSSGAGMALWVGLRSASSKSLAYALQVSRIVCIGGQTTYNPEIIGEIFGIAEIVPKKLVQRLFRLAESELTTQAAIKTFQWVSPSQWVTQCCPPTVMLYGNVAKKRGLDATLHDPSFAHHLRTEYERVGRGELLVIEEHRDAEVPVRSVVSAILGLGSPPA